MEKHLATKTARGARVKARGPQFVELQLIAFGIGIGFFLCQFIFIVRDRVPVSGSGFVMNLGPGLELGVSEAAGGLWSGVYVLERTEDGTPFRWSNGDAKLVLPTLDRPATYADVTMASPNDGTIAVSMERPSSAPSGILTIPAHAGAVEFHVPLEPYQPGTVITFHTTNRVLDSPDPRTLSVQFRSVLLVP